VLQTDFADLPETISRIKKREVLRTQENLHIERIFLHTSEVGVEIQKDGIGDSNK